MHRVEKQAELTGLVSILVFIVPISPVKGECNQCENIMYVMSSYSEAWQDLRPLYFIIHSVTVSLSEPSKIF